MKPRCDEAEGGGRRIPPWREEMGERIVSGGDPEPKANKNARARSEVHNEMMPGSPPKRRITGSKPEDPILISC
jgi:hypothetical protein